MKDQSYSAMKNALKHAQAVSFLFIFYLELGVEFTNCPLQALHMHPNDKAILYNIAMIQQKSAELLFSINVTKRSLKDLQRAIDSAAHAQK
jgi:RNA polymerase-associated protein CTR9